MLVWGWLVTRRGLVGTSQGITAVVREGLLILRVDVTHEVLGQLAGLLRTGVGPQAGQEPARVVEQEVAPDQEDRTCRPLALVGASSHVPYSMDDQTSQHMHGREHLLLVRCERAGQR